MFLPTLTISPMMGTSTLHPAAIALPAQGMCSIARRRPPAATTAVGGAEEEEGEGGERVLGPLAGEGASGVKSLDRSALAPISWPA